MLSPSRVALHWTAPPPPPCPSDIYGTQPFRSAFVAPCLAV